MASAACGLWNQSRCKDTMLKGRESVSEMVAYFIWMGEESVRIGLLWLIG